MRSLERSRTMTYGHDRDQSSSIFSATESDTLAMIRSVSPLDWLMGGAVFVAIVVGAFAVAAAL